MKYSIILLIYLLIMYSSRNRDDKTAYYRLVYEKQFMLDLIN